MKIATLGPQGTYSVQAAKTYGPNAEVILCNTIREAIARVGNGAAAQAVIPLENSIEGIVTESLDTIAAQPGLRIVNELVLDISHSLCALNEAVLPDAVQKVYSHPQALSQCSNFIAQHYPNAEIITTASTAAGLWKIANEQDSLAVAIGSEFGAAEYGLTVLKQAIEDEPGNQTRFVVISKEPGTQLLPFILAATSFSDTDRPGLLHDILGIIKHHGINLQQIDSRPNRTRLGSYIFYLRLQMSSDDSRFEAIVSEAGKINVTIRRMSA